jgi:uncharacterized protein YaaN involved in tellurite resistance
MDILLPLYWYAESPIDFEYKQYTLLSYLQIVDSSFIQKNLSPHYLHMERMVNDMIKFHESLVQFKKRFDNERYIFFQDNPKLENENNELIEEIDEIVLFSIPLVKSRLVLGENILKKTNQVLY